MTARMQIEMNNLRRMKALAFTDALMLEIEDLVPSVDREAICRRIYDVLYENGASWTTDAEREKMGLEPRDERGWTPSARVQFEIDRRNALLSLSEFHANGGLTLEQVKSKIGIAD